MDRYFTSVSVAEWATSKGFTIVGTMRPDRTNIPKSLKEIGAREEKSTLYLHSNDQDNMMLVSYIDKKKSGEKNVTLLTTMHDKVRVSRHQQ